MPPAKFVCVTSFSSQDEKFPARNLLRSDGGKWLSHREEKSGKMDIELQMSEAAVISHIDVGNSGSATICIKVAHSSWSRDRPYETLLPPFTLMSPQDARTWKHAERVEMFKSPDFQSEVQTKEWDRIRVFLTQPHTVASMSGRQFGLSLFRVQVHRPVDPSRNGALATAVDRTTLRSRLPSSSVTVSLASRGELLLLRAIEKRGAASSSAKASSPRPFRWPTSQTSLPRNSENDSADEFENDVLTFLKKDVNLNQYDVNDLKISSICEVFETFRSKTLTSLEKERTSRICERFVKEIRGRCVEEIQCQKNLLLPPDDVFGMNSTPGAVGRTLPPRIEGVRANLSGGPFSVSRSTELLTSSIDSATSTSRIDTDVVPDEEDIGTPRRREPSGVNRDSEDDDAFENDVREFLRKELDFSHYDLRALRVSNIREVYETLRGKMLCREDKLKFKRVAIAFGRRLLEKQESDKTTSPEAISGSDVTDGVNTIDGAEASETPSSSRIDSSTVSSRRKALANLITASRQKLREEDDLSSPVLKESISGRNAVALEDVALPPATPSSTRAKGDSLEPPKKKRRASSSIKAPPQLSFRVSGKERLAETPGRTTPAVHSVSDSEEETSRTPIKIPNFSKHKDDGGQKFADRLSIEENIPSGSSSAQVVELTKDTAGVESEVPSKARVRCPICNKFFQADEVDQHAWSCVQSIRSERTDLVVCPLCSKDFSCLEIERHSAGCQGEMASPEGKVDCPICNLKFARSSIEIHTQICALSFD